MKTYPHQENGEIIELVRKDEHDAVVAKLKEELDWQNQRNSGTPTRGGYEFYINEEWQSGGTPSLMRKRYDPDDERVRVRRVIEDDYLLAEINKLRADNAELLERLRERTESHLAASARDVATIQRQAVELGKQQDDIFNLRRQIAVCVDDLRKWQALTKTLAKSIGGLSPIYGTTPAQDQALAAYDAAKSGNETDFATEDQLAEAVKRMEAISLDEMAIAWANYESPTLVGSLNGVRACLIQAAKGEQP